METKGRRTSIDLPTIHQPQSCNFEGYNAISLMAETAKLRKLNTKRGTLEILIPLCCTTNPVRYLKFRETMKGFSSKTLAISQVMSALQSSGLRIGVKEDSFESFIRTFNTIFSGCACYLNGICI